MIESSIQKMSRKKKPLAAILTFILGALGFGLCQKLADPVQRQICQEAINGAQNAQHDED